MPTFTVYSIALDPAVARREPWFRARGRRPRGFYYVGNSAHTARCKARLHAAGGELANPGTWPRCSCTVKPGQPVKPVGSNVARDYGRGLDTAWSYRANYDDRADAWSAERELAERLLDRGFGVYTDQRRGRPAGMYPILRSNPAEDAPSAALGGPASFDARAFRVAARAAGFDALARWLAAPGPKADLTEAWYAADGVVDYASGSNRAGEIQGFAALGRPIGVAAHECGAACEAELVGLAGSGIPVFLDSGAFSEVRIRKGAPPEVVKPITGAEWERRLALYDRLAAALGPQLTVVAPDLVGHQQPTLERLTRYAGRIASLREAGARVLVPLHAGELPIDAFDEAVAGVLGADGYTPAIPMPARDYLRDPAELAAVMGWLAHRQPRDLHLLGLGLRSDRVPVLLPIIREVVPGIALTMDSNKIAAGTGWGEGRAKPRPLTRADEEALIDVLYSDEGVDDEGMGTDWTEDAAVPESWLTPKQIRTFCHALRLPNDVRRRCMGGLDEWLQERDADGSPNWMDYRVQEGLRSLWEAMVRARTPKRRRRQAVSRAYQPHPTEAPSVKRRLVLVPARTGQMNAYVTERHYLHRGRTMAQQGYWLLWQPGAKRQRQALADDLQRLPAQPAPPGQPWTIGGYPIEGGVHFAYPRRSSPVAGYHPMEVLELARLYLEPDPRTGRNPPNRASQAIRASSNRVIEDWPSKYPGLPEPRAVFSQADLTRHTGGIYKAAGFEHVGDSERGRRQGDAKGRQGSIFEGPEAGAPGARRGPRTEGRHTVRHADEGHAKASYLLRYKPPGPQRRNIAVVFGLGGVTREGAEDVCDHLIAHAQMLGVRGLDKIDRRRMCDWFPVGGEGGGHADFGIPLVDRTDDAPSYPDLAMALGELFVEASWDQDYAGDSYFEWRLFEDGKPIPDVDALGTHGAVQNPRRDRRRPGGALSRQPQLSLPLPRVLPPAARRFLARLVGSPLMPGRALGMARPFPAGIDWLLEHGLARTTHCVPAAQTLYHRETCTIAATADGRRAYGRELDDRAARMAELQTAMFPNPLPRSARNRWLM